MQLVTVGPKYQIVVPKEVRQQLKSLKPGVKVGIFLDGEYIAIDPQPESWVERTAGIMTEAWKGIDPIQELEKMRDEWEERLQDQEKIWNGTK